MPGRYAVAMHGNRLECPGYPAADITRNRKAISSKKSAADGRKI